MNKQKIIGLIIGIISFIAVIAGLTYAYIVWSSDSTNKLVSSKCFDVLYMKGKDINGAIMPSEDYTGGLSTQIKMNMSNSCDIKAKGKLYLNTLDTTTSNLFREGLLNYQVLKNKTLIASGNITNYGEIEIDLGTLVSSASFSTNYYVYVWVDNDLVQNSDVNSSYSGSIRVEAVQAEDIYVDSTPTTSVNLINHINTLYKNNVVNSPVTFADGSGSNYYAPGVRLMNDGLDSEGNETNDINLGNIRYYGENDDKLNNYIYFNCLDYSDVSTCEKWRIVGIVDGKVKIMKNGVLGSYNWEYDGPDTTSVNDWYNASLNEILNNAYYKSSISEDYIYNGNGSTTLHDFSNSGITDATRDNNLISMSDWFVNYVDNVDMHVNLIYVGERNGTYTWSGNIALLYPSDYGYAADLNECRDKIGSYASCAKYNWMNNILTKNESNQVWLLNPSFVGSQSACFINAYGNVSNHAMVHTKRNVTPTLYLNPDLIIEAGHNGSNNDPYRIVIS